MKPGDIVLIRLAQIGGRLPKLRPALVLSRLPGTYQNVLICGISTQLHQLEPDWDELIQPSDADFPSSGLHRSSAARLSYLYAADETEISGAIGEVSADRLFRMRARLAKHLTL